MTLFCFSLFSFSARGMAESVPQKMELAEAAAKLPEEIKKTEDDIKKTEAQRDALLKDSRAIQTQIKRRGIKDEAKASTRALETTREMYAKTREYNNLQQTLEKEQDKAFGDWCIAKGSWLVGEKTKQNWDATPEAKNLMQANQQKLDGSYSKWKSEMDELAKKGSKGYGIDDSVVQDQDQRQKDNLEAFRKNDEELDRLRNRLKQLQEMTDHDYQREAEKPKETEDEDLKPDHEFFFFSTAERMDRDTHLKKNEMINVQFSLSGGAPPYTLATSSINSEDNRTISVAKRPSMGEHLSFPVTFSTSGTRSMEFTCADSDGKIKSVTIVFYVDDEKVEEKKEETKDAGKEESKEDEEFKKLQEEEYKKALDQARTMIAKGHTSETAVQGVIAKVTKALNAAQEAEVKINSFDSAIKTISQKIQELDQLSSQASSSAPVVANTSSLGEGVAKSAYDDVTKARAIACGVVAGIGNSSTPDADAQKALKAADDAEMAAAEVQGEGKTAIAAYTSAKATLDELWTIRRKMEDLAVEIAGLTTQVSELPGLIASANAEVSAISGSGDELPKFVSEVENAKSGALGILNLYSARPEAQILIGQANALGSSLNSEKNVNSLIQEAQAVVARLQKVSSGAISPNVPAFPVDTAALDEKVEELRTSADTIELFESRCQSEAGVARTCADSAKSIAESKKDAKPQDSGETPPDSGEEPPPQPPSWWSPTGESVGGPSVPNIESQKAAQGSATKQIEQGNQPIPPHGGPNDHPPQQPQGPAGNQQPQGQGSGATPSGHYPGDGDGC